MVPATDEATWLRFIQQHAREWFPPAARTLVIAPHPDDETLGAGGLMAAQRIQNVPVLAIAVTDGEAAYPREGLAALRRSEQEHALAELGVESQSILRLSLPDGEVRQHEERLFGLLQSVVKPGDLLLAPWCYDPHPDHEVCGRVAERVAAITNAILVSYFFWTWHYKRVESLAALPLRQFNLDASCQHRKARALSHYNSQLQHESREPVLPEILLAPARRPFEVFLY